MCSGGLVIHRFSIWFAGCQSTAAGPSYALSGLQDVNLLL